MTYYSALFEHIPMTKQSADETNKNYEVFNPIQAISLAQMGLVLHPCLHLRLEFLGAVHRCCVDKERNPFLGMNPRPARSPAHMDDQLGELLIGSRHLV